MIIVIINEVQNQTITDYFWLLKTSKHLFLQLKTDWLLTLVFFCAEMVIQHKLHKSVLQSGYTSTY